MLNSYVFISYSRKDHRWLTRIRTMLEPLVRIGALEVWDDTQIEAGVRWRDELKAALSASRVVLMLVSPDFLASDFIARQEIIPILEGAQRAGQTILWIPVRASLVESTPLSQFQAALDPDRPLASLRAAQVDEALAEICRKVIKALNHGNTDGAGSITTWKTHDFPEVPKPAETSAAANVGDQSPVLSHVSAVILYRRLAKPDYQIVQWLEAALAECGCEVFVDQDAGAAMDWTRVVEPRIREADVVIAILSELSIWDDMLLHSLQVARDAALSSRADRPMLIPVCVGRTTALPAALADLLSNSEPISWNTPKDDRPVLDAVVRTLSRSETPRRSVPTLEAIGGAMPVDSRYYVVRPTDDAFLSAISRQDSVVLIKGARQMGKTSLLARGLDLARKRGARVVRTDFQKFNASQLQSAETLYIALADSLAEQLGIEASIDDFWNPRRGPNINFERYLVKQVLEPLTAPLVWGLDEVDRLFTCPYGSEVFGLFRSWHNDRSLDPQGPWKLLTLVIAYATEAHLFISDINQSPFNVGTLVALDDFTPTQVADLNLRYGAPLRNDLELERFVRLLGGHPYLVRRGLNELSSGAHDLEQLEIQAQCDEGPFRDHLRRMLVLLSYDTNLCSAVRGVLRGQCCPSLEAFYRLRSAGVILGDTTQEVRPRCQLYATYLRRHLL